jgi:hypothetical protein
MKPTCDEASFEDQYLATPSKTYSADGVDLSLIRWMLTLTPDERLDLLDHSASDLLELRDGGNPV